MGASALEDLGVMMGGSGIAQEKSRTRARRLGWLALGFVAVGCASSFLKYEKVGELKQIQEFDQQVQIVTPPDPEDKNAAAIPSPSPTPRPSPTPEPESKSKPGKKKPKKTKKKTEEEAAVPAANLPLKHEPELEGQEGFVGRRPAQDPFRPGEKVVHEVSYFNVKAGELTLAVKPMAQVNGRKNYHFFYGLKTSSLFSSFYSVDDQVDSLMEFDRMIPSVFTVHVKESAQLRESRFFIDWSKLQASYWDKKVTKKDGPEEKKMQWDVAEYTQDLFSSAFYMRVFPWKVGEEHAFRVTDNGENLIFRGKALRRETIETEAGTFQTLVIKPDVELRGQFKPVGDIFFWLTDDDRHFLVKIESKIKIGTIVSEVIDLNPGKPDEGP